MDSPLVIENARLIDPATGRDEPGAVLIDNKRIAEIAAGGAPGAPEGAERIDAKGLVLAPGLIDLRVFTGEPGHEYRETLASAADAAAAGGVTTFLLMPDTDPVIDETALVDYVIRRARGISKIRIYPAAALSKGLRGQEITEFGLLKEAGARALTEGRASLADAGLFRAALTYARNFEMPVIHHVADAALTGDGVMNAGALATALGLKGIPVEAETIPLDRDLQLAIATGARYHTAQISCAASADIVRRALARSDRVSCGVSVNSLALNENDIGSYRTFFKLSPPLRAEEDRQAMVAALADGTITTIHSAHDPQDAETKRRPFAEAADGAVGLETLLAVALRLYHSGDVDLMTLLRALTSSPADLLGLPAGRLRKGDKADLILLDLDRPWVVSAAALSSRSRNTCFQEARLTGKVVRTFVSGRTVYDGVD